jgi:hypothetical protein
MSRAVTSTIAGVVAGLAAWFVVATVINLALRAWWPGYVQVEATLNFTLGMMGARLTLAAVSSVCAGFVVALVSKGGRWGATALGAVLTAMFVPVHYGIWEQLPVWYHLTFLVSLLPLTLLGAKLQPHVRSR